MMNRTAPEERKAVEDNTSCGFFGFKPQCLKVFNNFKVFMVLMCVFSFIQGFIVNGITNAITTTLERRFQLSSYQVGMQIASYDMAAGITAIPIGFYGMHAHKPRMLAIGAIFLGVGSIIMSIPHFASGLYTYGSAIDTCSLSGNATVCVSSTETYLPNFIYVLALGQVIQGVGGTTLYTIGTSCIDDNVPSANAALYLGTFFAFGAVGPAVGFLAGGQFLDLYVDFDKVDTKSISINPVDPEWVGAWWVPYIIFGILSICLSIPLFGYGRELPCTAQIRAQRVTQTHQNGSEATVSREGYGTTIRDFPVAVWILLKNPIFVFVSFAAACEFLLVGGFAAFLSKFIQNQYGQSASFAAILTGIVAVVGVAGGQFLGGVISTCMKLKVRGMAKLCMTVSVAMIILNAALWIKCDQEKLAGITLQYSDTTMSIANVDLTASCNSNCGCTTESYSPVCAENGVFYFSQCHAGCLGASADRTEFYNCSCVLQDASYTGNSTKVTAGKCKAPCSMMYLFVGGFFLAVLFMSMANAPGASMVIRCIPERQKTFALALKWTVVRFLGSVPGPIIFGAFIDQTCTQWQEKCGVRASCWIYDTFKMSLYLYLAAIGFKLVSLCLFFFAYYFYKPPPKQLENGDANAPMAETVTKM